MRSIPDLVRLSKLFELLKKNGITQFQSGELVISFLKQEQAEQSSAIGFQIEQEPDEDDE